MEQSISAALVLACFVSYMFTCGKKSMAGGAYSMSRTPSTRPLESRHLDRAETIAVLLVNEGWDQGFVDRAMADILPDVWDEILDHSDVDVVKYLCHGWIFESQTDYDTSQFVDLLLAAGLEQDVAEQIADVLRPHLEYSSFDRRQLVDVAIEYALGEYQPRLPQRTPYFHKDQEENTWFEVDGEAHFNTTFDNLKVQDVRDWMLSTGRVKPGNVLFYHCTASGYVQDNVRAYNTASNKEIAAGKILKHSRPRLDFGAGKSFYLTPTLGTAINWGIKRGCMWDGEVSIMVFELPTPDAIPLRTKIFDVESDDWWEYVKASRHPPDDKFRRESDDIVYGPILANPGPDPNLWTSLPGQCQLAAKTQRAMVYVMNAYRGSIHMNKFQKGSDRKILNNRSCLSVARPA
jgi:hypothetical protein